MQAQTFYTRDASTNPVSLVLICRDEYSQIKESLPLCDKAYWERAFFQGEVAQHVLVHDADGQLNKVYIGVGENKQVEAMAYAATVVPGGQFYQSSQSLSLQAQSVWSLAQYRFDRYKKTTREPARLLVESNLLDSVLIEANMVFFIRDLINTPTNDLGPEQLGEITKQLAETYGAQFNAWVGDELLKANFPAIHAVGRASVSAPRLLSLKWGNSAHPHITLVGKGVCFDSGGLDIKPANAMRLMKKDMGGAAQVLGLAQWIMAKSLPVYLSVYIPAVENAVGGDAFRPGDILTMRNGLTVEIDNTDAEGRLVLADALVKSCEEPLDLLIDFATLTGAARIAVGTEISAMFTPNDELAASIQNVAQSVNDPVWRLPLFEGYQSMLDSSIADIQNASPSSYAGAIVAGLFLQRFVAPQIPWIHFDVMAWNVSNKPGKPEGGEAMGVRAIAHYLLTRYS